MDIQKEKKAIKDLKALYMDEWDLTEEQKDEFDALVSRVFKVGKEQTKAQAIPEGFVLVPKDQITSFWQDADEPENFCSTADNFNALGDCIDLGDIMEINKHTQAHISTEKLCGTWVADFGNPSQQSKFFVGTREECEAIVQKNEEALIETVEGE